MSIGNPDEQRRYRIEFKPSAAEALERLGKQDQVNIGRKIDALSINPRPHNSQKLKGEANTYRIRSGDYRILYDIMDDVLMIDVVRIGHRGDIYKKHKRNR